MGILNKFKDRLTLIREKRRQDSYDLSALRGARRLALFFIPKREEITGGIMSIFSLAKYSRIVDNDLVSLIVTLPASVTHSRNSLFPNDEQIYRMEQIVKNASPDEIILHIPEYATTTFVGRLSKDTLKFFRGIRRVHVNILNQNIAFMPPPEQWHSLFSIASIVTQTTDAHRYSNQDVCNRFGIPLHLFSVHIDQTGWPWRNVKEREKLIVLVPDDNPCRDKFCSVLRDKLSDYKVVVVKNLKFSEYLDLISHAFACVTFEGFDLYFKQIIATGGLSIAVYNERYFPSPDWMDLGNVYANGDELVENFAKDIRYLERHEDEYEKLVDTCALRLRNLFSIDTYCDNLKRFYQGKYDFTPTK